MRLTNRSRLTQIWRPARCRGLRIASEQSL